MDVKIKAVPGCMQFFLAVVTLGIYPLMAWLNLRNWPKSLDDQGLVTRAGTRIAWSAFTKITKVITDIQRGAAKTEHFELTYPKGKVIVAPYRLEDGGQVFDYVWQRLPAQARQSK